MSRTPLPILQVSTGPADRDIVRLFHRTELHWTQSLAEETALECGTAFANCELDRVPAANRIFDAALPDHLTVESALAEAAAHFARQGSRCLEWIFNPSAAPAATEPLLRQLLASGWRAEAKEILHLQSHSGLETARPADLTIIPARASYRHMQLLADEIASECSEPQLAAAVMLHLDDPHWDALLAMSGHEPAGTIGVLSVGEIGRIDQLFVSRAFRRRGIGRTLLARAMEICARSLFRHVMLAIKPDDAITRAMLKGATFRTVGQITGYRVGI